MNRHSLWAIYRFEMARMFRTLLQSIVAPVISTSLYFVVFGSAIGGRIFTIPPGSCSFCWRCRLRSTSWTRCSTAWRISARLARSIR